MNELGIKKLSNALPIITNMEAQLSNFLKRAPEGIKSWKDAFAMPR